MTETNTRIRLATTAIVAALAISSTPLLAQDAPAPDTAQTPVTPATDPLAPEPVADTATETPAAESSASETSAAPARPRTARRATSQPAERQAPRPQVAPLAAAAPAPESTIQPTEAPPATQVAPLPPAEPVPVEPAASRLALTNETLPIAGAALIGLLALVGAFLLIRRRRRLRAIEDEEVYYQTEAEFAEPEPVIAEPLREPAFVAAPAAAAVASAPVPDPVPEEDKSTGLPAGFDLSRFGPHVQAAYRGPTPDNPSASLKHRIRQAGAMDRAEDTYRCEPASPEPADATIAKRPETDPARGDFMLRQGEVTTDGRRAFNKVD